MLNQILNVQLQDLSLKMFLILFLILSDLSMAILIKTRASPATGAKGSNFFLQEIASFI